MHELIPLPDYVSKGTFARLLSMLDGRTPHWEDAQHLIHLQAFAVRHVQAYPHMESRAPLTRRLAIIALTAAYPDGEITHGGPADAFDWRPLIPILAALTADLSTIRYPFQGDFDHGARP